MGRKREEIDVLASHYYCRANWQGYYIPHNGATVFLEGHFGGIFWRNILEGYFGGIFPLLAIKNNSNPVKVMHNLQGEGKGDSLEGPCE